MTADFLDICRTVLANSYENTGHEGKLRCRENSKIFFAHKYMCRDFDELQMFPCFLRSAFITAHLFIVAMSMSFQLRSFTQINMPYLCLRRADTFVMNQRLIKWIDQREFTHAYQYSTEGKCFFAISWQRSCSLHMSVFSSGGLKTPLFMRLPVSKPLFEDMVRMRRWKIVGWAAEESCQKYQVVEMRLLMIFVLKGKANSLLRANPFQGISILFLGRMDAFIFGRQSRLFMPPPAWWEKWSINYHFHNKPRGKLITEPKKLITE